MERCRFTPVAKGFKSEKTGPFLINGLKTFQPFILVDYELLTPEWLRFEPFSLHPNPSAGKLTDSGFRRKGLNSRLS